MAKLYDKEENKVSKDEQKEVGLWHERISITKKEQEQWAGDSGAKRFLKEYEGDYGIVFFARNRQVPIPPINEVFSYVQSDIATTFNRDPYIEVNAEAGTTKGAALWEVILNYYWRVLKIKEEIEYEIIEKDLVGYGWHKTGSNKDGKPYSNYVCWDEVLWNIGSKRPPVDCMWMAHKITMPLTKIKKEFPAAKGMEGSPNPEVNKDSYKTSAYKDDIKIGVIWEIWDKEKREIVLIADNLKDRYLAPKRPWPDHVKDFPLDMYWDFAIPKKPRPMSSIAPWEKQILEEMVIMGSAINHAKRWNRQLFIKGGNVDDNSLDKFERGDDGAVITVNGKMDDSSFKFADFGQLPTDFYLLMDRLQAIKRNINGQPEFAKGGVTKTGTRTIGELQLMQQGNQSRQGRKIDRLETHCENIARKIMAELKANFDLDETVRITGEVPDEIIAALENNYDKVTQTVKFTPEEIQGEYDVDIKSGSTLPMDKQTKMQVLEIVGQVIAQAAASGLASNLVVAWLGEMLDGFDIKSLKEAFQADLKAAEEAKQQDAQQQHPDEMKTLAEAEKRLAQTEQIKADTEISILQAKLEAMKGPEEKTPSESISFKDLPEMGRIQMAAQAGIHLTPEQAAKLPPQPPKTTTNGAKK